MKHQSVTIDSVLLPGANAATTVRTANLDISDANYASIRVALGAELNTNSTNVAIQLSESDDTVVTNFATFDAVFNRTVDNTAAVVAACHVDCEGRKRYLRLTVTPDTTTNGPVTTAAVASLVKTVQDGSYPSDNSVAVG
jgi:hypothetical protein